MKKIAFIIVLVALTSCFGVEPQKTGKEGKSMPDFNIQLADGNMLHTRDIPTGKPIVLFYFSPYCPYCKALTEDIIEDMDDLKELQFYFVTTLGTQDLKQFAKEHQLAKYPNIFTGLDTARYINEYFGPRGIPYTAVFSKDKILNKTFVGKIGTGRILKAAKE